MDVAFAPQRHGKVRPVTAYRERGDHPSPTVTAGLVLACPSHPRLAVTAANSAIQGLAHLALDCFGPEPAIGPRFARTRWGLAKRQGATHQDCRTGRYCDHRAGRRPDPLAARRAPLAMTEQLFPDALEDADARHRAGHDAEAGSINPAVTRLKAEADDHHESVACQPRTAGGLGRRRWRHCAGGPRRDDTVNRGGLWLRPRSGHGMRRLLGS
jgi:hypothetical protein